MLLIKKVILRKVYVYVFTCLHVHICTHIYMYECLCVCMHVCVSMFVHMPVYACGHMCACMCMCIWSKDKVLSLKEGGIFELDVVAHVFNPGS